jgi:hypothetical protein
MSPFLNKLLLPIPKAQRKVTKFKTLKTKVPGHCIMSQSTALGEVEYFKVSIAKQIGVP